MMFHSSWWKMSLISAGASDHRLVLRVSSMSYCRSSRSCSLSVSITRAMSRFLECVRLKSGSAGRLFAAAALRLLLRPWLVALARVGTRGRGFGKRIDAILMRLVDHREHVLGGYIVLQAMRARQQVATALCHLPDARAHFGAHLLDRSPGKGLLHVDAAVEEHLPTERALLGRRIGMAGDLRRQAVGAVHAAVHEAAHERLGERAAAVELDLAVGIFLEVILFGRLDRAHVVRLELGIEHRERLEARLLARKILGAHPDPVQVFAALVDHRLVGFDLDID